MGTSSSFNERTKNSVHENMLASTLSGDVTGDDYLAISHKALTELEEQKPDNKFTGAETFMDIGNAFMMLEEGLQPLEQGFHRQSDGCWYIACLTDLGTECTGEMFDWWLRNCTDAERFKWWHPRDHVSGNWDPQFFAVQPEDRDTGYYINHSHKTSLLIGGKLRTLQIEYDRPSKYFDITKFPEKGVTACVAARVHMIESHGLSGIAHVIHMVRLVNGRSELRSRIWLGDYNRVDDNSILPLWCINSLGNSKLFRYSKAPQSVAKAVWEHCRQEMHCLRSFLPDFYHKEMTRRANLIPFEIRMSPNSQPYMTEVY